MLTGARLGELKKRPREVTFHAAYECETKVANSESSGVIVADQLR